MYFTLKKISIFWNVYSRQITSVHRVIKRINLCIIFSSDLIVVITLEYLKYHSINYALALSLNTMPIIVAVIILMNQDVAVVIKSGINKRHSSKI